MSLVDLKMQYFIDVQRFKLPINKFVLKELAIVSLNNNLMPLNMVFNLLVHGIAS